MIVRVVTKGLNNYINDLIVLALDAMDSSGEQHLQIDHNIYKRRYDLNGRPINDPIKEDITIKHKEAEVIDCLTLNHLLTNYLSD